MLDSERKVTSNNLFNILKVNNSILSDQDIYLFNEGNFLKSYEKLGCLIKDDGAYFSVWAPNASAVSVIGDFNSWNPNKSQMTPLDNSGLWTIFCENVKEYCHYKYLITNRDTGEKLEKIDPYAKYSEVRPKHASLTYDHTSYKWNDQVWINKQKNFYQGPANIYELHLGSWQHFSNEYPFFGVTYKKLADTLPQYLNEMGFTHVELLPFTEHPFDGSWGYQTTGYYSPTSRFGEPRDLMLLVDALHQADIGVILDWVPAHFATDSYGLHRFDGTHLYEHADPKKGFHPDWGTYIFNLGRKEVENFLISNALYWLEIFHIDGLRIDAVASMLYLDYSRKEGEWIPNKEGGRENLESIEFFKKLNSIIGREHPNVIMIAEESTAWPKVTKPTSEGGLGFGCKWNMGWMNDTLKYFSKDPIYRSYDHSNVTFSFSYTHTENYILPLSHDEVVHGKGSLLNKMPGDDWQKFANLRLLYTYMYSHPGKNLLFMGSELASLKEWSHERSLDWHLLNEGSNQGIKKLIQDLNLLTINESALHEADFDGNGFKWISGEDTLNSVLSFLRLSKDETILCLLNFTPIPRVDYEVGIPLAGKWQEIFNSDSFIYGGTNTGNLGFCQTQPKGIHGYADSLKLTLPPLSGLLLKKIK